MTKSRNQKLKPLYLMRILLERSDDEHPLSVADIQRELARYDITAERKSLYDDMEALRGYGLDVERRPGAKGGYYAASRTFQLAELKLLVDCVQSSRFITQKKSRELIGKLESLTSVYQARSLHRQVYMANRAKSMNESVYYNIDYIHTAIDRDSQLSFRYLEYQLNQERCYRRGGKQYQISPFMLIWNNDRYYMVGYDGEAGMIKHFRVDRMTGLSVLAAARQGKALLQGIDPAAYAEQHFSMFGGEAEPVRISFDKQLLDVALDRFGRGVTLTERAGERFLLSARVALNSQFYGWIFSLGGGAEIISPLKAAREYRDMATRAAGVQI